jgi:hypothetical protein
MLLSATGCSLPPEVPVTKEELYRTGIYSYYTIRQSPESVLAALNRDGEVVLDARYKDQPLYIRVMVLPSGLQVYSYEQYPLGQDKPGR